MKVGVKRAPATFHFQPLEYLSWTDSLSVVVCMDVPVRKSISLPKTPVSEGGRAEMRCSVTVTSKFENGRRAWVRGASRPSMRGRSTTDTALTREALRAQRTALQKI